MILVDAFAQSYRWPLSDILALTMPQIYMLNAAARVNKERIDRRIAKGRATGTSTLEDQIADVPMWNGKRVDELTSEEYVAYHASALY